MNHFLALKTVNLHQVCENHIVCNSSTR